MALGLALLMTGLIAPDLTGTVAHADDGVVQAAAYVADQVDPAVEQVSYTVGQSGHRYKWTPYQPKSIKKVEPLRAEAAQFTTPVATQPNQPTPIHPLDDPFGDAQQAAQDSLLPSMQQFLADETDQKSRLDDLLSPPTLDDDTAEPQPLQPFVANDLSQPESDQRSTEDLLADRRESRTQNCQVPDDVLKPMDELDYTTTIRDDEMRRDTKYSDPANWPQTCDLAGGEFMPRQWAPTTFMWKASGLCHKPAYFEDVHLERYGHSWGPYVQPLMSGAHFFLNVPVLPYKMGLYPPNECIYTLGYYRPGSCAPYMLDPLPLSVRAALAQAGATVGMAYLLP